MPVFEYQARTSTGEVQSGRVEAPSKNGAISILQRHGLIVVSLEKAEEGAVYAHRLKFLERVKGKDLAIFSRQMAALFEASVPLVISLHTVAEQTQNQKLQDTLLDIAADVDGGSPFSKALEKYSDIFSGFYTQMIKAGEESGTMDEVLVYLADYTEREYKISSKVSGAMIYPAFVLGVFAIVGAGMMIFVIPNLLGIIEQSGAELPLITKIIVAISDILRNQWYIVLAALIGGGVGGWRLIKTPQGKDLWDRVKLRIPIIGQIYQKIYLFRFAESFSLLVRGGVALNESLSISAGVMDNVVYKQIILDARDKVTRGESMAKTFGEYPEISPLVVQMIAVGEKTGQLDSILRNVSKFYEDEVTNTVDNLVSLIEPILIVIMGLGAAFLMAGILLPIYTSISAVQ
ncbi:MAG: type II secretion system F family protein [Candidatus Spechtbacterales bacterium]